MKRIVGIGLAEKIELAWAFVDARGRYTSDIRYEFGELPQVDATSESINVQMALSTFLDWAKQNPRSTEIFDGRTTEVGFSSIGRVDRDRNRMLRVVRKNWTHHEDSKGKRYMVDFNQVAESHFGKNVHVRATNDATCAAIAEIQRLKPRYNAQAMKEIYLYITINEGVNIGIVNRRSELQFGDHPEFGHVYPRPHPTDFDLVVREGCRAHGRCYEALASAARIRETWGRNGLPGSSGDLSNFDPQHEAWGIIAFYIAQLCLAGHAVFYPKKIILGGTVIWGQKPDGPNCPSAAKIRKNLMPRIWEWYATLRGDYPMSRADPWGLSDPLKMASALIQRGEIHTMANANGLH